MKPALLVIDVQKAFFEIDPATAQSLVKAIEYINAAIALFRDRELPVSCVQHMEPEDNLIPGAAGFELPDELNILDSDPHIHKTHGNAFNKTPLADKLRTNCGHSAWTPSSSPASAPSIVSWPPVAAQRILT